jgi:hypothetical protein
MSTQIEQSVIQPRPHVQIISRRLTCVGMQYRLADDYGTCTVTVNNDMIGCNCGAEQDYVVCTHVDIVEKREQDYIEQAKRREIYCELFSIYSDS